MVAAIPALSIVMPVLNEAPALAAALAPLQAFRQRGVRVVVVDGGSEDGTLAVAQAFCDLALSAPRGRASQLNAGAAACPAAAFLFLHADTRLPANADVLVHNALHNGRAWGRFDVCIDSHRPLLSVVSRAMNMRSRWSGIATGDQAIFVAREAFAAVGGFADIALMEDIAMSRALKRVGPPACLREVVYTSARRWERHGILRTIFLMWRLRARFFFGASPDELAREYGYRPR
ncbi:MAG: TIGR04283 family arsenosugar biosynthesis glycosyltransferase [Rhodoferax sp.]|nr:TIGR04283 family arsenosugar biosynthesis glycosyltransferase [Rhodoferax sp.]